MNCLFRSLGSYRVVVLNETLHPNEASFIKRLEDIERGKQKSARAAGWVEDRNLFDSLPDSAQQFRPFAKLDYILCELADIQVERDQIIDLMHLSGSQLGLDCSITLMAIDGFTPNLGGKREFRWRSPVPTTALLYIRDASQDV